MEETQNVHDLECHTVWYYRYFSFQLEHLEPERYQPASAGVLSMLFCGFASRKIWIGDWETYRLVLLYATMCWLRILRDEFQRCVTCIYVHCAPCSELFVIVMYPLMYPPETSVFDTQTTCPASDPKYTPTKRHTSRDWMKRSECPREISITTLHFFLKDYQNYGIWI